MSKVEEQEQEECCQTYYKCKFCHATTNDFYSIDCDECENENCIECLQMTETELEELLEKLGNHKYE